MPVEVIFTRAKSVAERIESLLRETSVSVDAALYRFNNPRLASALVEAVRRTVKVRVVLDRNKYDESPSLREIFAKGRIAFRLSYGRQGAGSKMHHKFALLDGHTALTGSYNWTLESEGDNFENLVILREPRELELYAREFETLWAEAAPPS